MPAIPFIVAGAAIAGAATSVVGAVNTSNARKDAASEALEMGKENADIMRRQATQVGEAQKFGMAGFDRQAGQFLGAQGANFAQQGVTTGGSSALARADSIRNLSADRRNLHQNYKVKIDELHNKARLSEKHGASQSDILNTQATADILGGVGQGLGFLAQGASAFA